MLPVLPQRKESQVIINRNAFNGVKKKHWNNSRYKNKSYKNNHKSKNKNARIKNEQENNNLYK